MGKHISLTCDEGSILLRASRNLTMPKEVGAKKFSDNMIATFTKEFRQLWKTLRDASPMMKEDRVDNFGPRSNWEKGGEITITDKDGAPTGEKRTIWNLLDRQLEVEVDLSGKAKNAAYWILFLCCHPASKSALPPGMQEDYVWPIAEKLGCVPALEKDTGISENETIAIKFDDEEKLEPTKTA